MSRALPVSVRIALRELRGGVDGFRIFLACLALGVAAIAAVGTVRGAITEGLTREAAAILGGDAEVKFTYRFASAEERAWMEGVATEVSEIVDFRSMVTLARDGAEPERALVQVKAVDGGYPLYGVAELADGEPLAAALAGGDGLPGLVAQRILIDRLDLEIGEVLRLGTTDFRLTGELVVEPDGAAAGFGLGPRVIVELEALAESGLLAEGSLFDSSYRLRLPPETDLGAVEAEGRGLFGETGLQWRDRRDGAPGVSAFVDRLGAFLVLLGLAGLAVGGVGVSAAVRAYLDGKTATIATLKTLGATGGTIFAAYLVQIGLLSLLGIAIGLVLGTGVPLLVAPLIEARLPVPAEFGIVPGALAEAALYGALTALIFTIWPLARARDIRAAELFRDGSGGMRRWPRPVYIAATAGAGGAAGRGRDADLRRTGARALDGGGHSRGAAGAAGGGVGRTSAGAAALSEQRHSRPPGVALGARRPRRALGRDRLGGALARARADRARRHRPDRQQPARADHRRAARTRSGLFLRGYPE